MTPGPQFPKCPRILGNFNILISPWDFHISPLVFPSGEVISSVSELQSLKVEPSAEKERQQSEAKHILMRKQRALADLFKHLAKTGKVLAWSPMKYNHQLLGRKTTWVNWRYSLETVEMVGNKSWQVRFWNAVLRVPAIHNKNPMMNHL